MRYFIFGISAVILISCSDNHYDFPEGDYLEEIYSKGEIDEIYEPKKLNGYLHDDTLFFAQTTYIKEDYYHEIKCNRDTHYYVRHIIKIPTNRKYDSAVHRWTTVECGSDGLNKYVQEYPHYFEVKRDYIDLISCPKDEKDCNPIEAWIQRLHFPNKGE